MTPSFFITKSFVKKIVFAASDEVQLCATPISHMETSLNADVCTSASENNIYHLVEIRVNISSETIDNTPVCNLILDYAAIVGTPEPVDDETDLNEILKIQVPKILLDNIRDIVYQVMREAGFPFMMRDDTFDHLVRKTEEEANTDSDLFEPVTANKQDVWDSSESEKIDFQWMINFKWAKDDSELLESIQNFWAVYSAGLEEKTFVNFESLPIYKCYYRFFTPIEYIHPDYEECDESIWPILFQMLYGSFKSQCQIIDSEDIPEIKISYEHFKDRTVSSLTLEELKELLSDLITEALVDISVKLLGYQNKGILSGELSQSKQLMSERDFYRLFDANVSDEKASFLSRMYERIKECNIQTLLYQE